MARDRLKAMREQQNNVSNNNSSSQSSPQQSTSTYNNRGVGEESNQYEYNNNARGNVTRGGGGNIYETRPNLSRQQGSYSTVASDQSRDPEYRQSTSNQNYRNDNNRSGGGGGGLPSGAPSRPQPNRQLSNSNSGPSNSNYNENDGYSRSGGGGNNRGNESNYEELGSRSYSNQPTRVIGGIKRYDNEDQRDDSNIGRAIYTPPSTTTSSSSRPQQQQQQRQNQDYNTHTSSDYNRSNQPPTALSTSSTSYTQEPLRAQLSSPTSFPNNNHQDPYTRNNRTSPTSTEPQISYNPNQNSNQQDPYSNRSRTPPSNSHSNNTHNNNNNNSLSPSKSTSTSRVAPPNYRSESTNNFGDAESYPDLSQAQSKDYGHGYQGNGNGNGASRNNSRKDLNEDERYEMQDRGNGNGNENSTRNDGTKGGQGPPRRIANQGPIVAGGVGMNMEEKNERSNSGKTGGGKRGGKTAMTAARIIGRGDVQYENMEDFFAEIGDLQDGIRETNNVITSIEALHLRILAFPSSDDPAALSLIENLSEETSTAQEYFAAIKLRVQALAQGNSDLTALISANQSEFNLTHQDVNVRNGQVENLKEKFKDAVQNYASVEREVREKKRGRMERQVKIVNPGLSSNEVRDVVRDAESGGGGGMFAQALLQSNGQRTYAARGALKEVQSRAVELAQIESTLIELAQLFNDMANLVVEQDIQVVQIESSAVEATNDIEVGLIETKKAVVSAKKSRKGRWWCFGILMTILVIVLIVVIIQVILPLIKKNQGGK